MSVVKSSLAYTKKSIGKTTFNVIDPKIPLFGKEGLGEIL
jgi:hypothetical protein